MAKQEYLENDYNQLNFVKKLAILKFDVEMDTDIDNYKISVKLKWTK
nr:hypothetical protein [Mycoplasmopsis bovis]